MFTGILEKLKSGLSKTRSGFTGRINEAIGAAEEINDDLFEELEEILITSDIGVETSLFIMEEIKMKVEKENIKDPSQIKDCLKEIVLSILGNKMNSIIPDRTPAVFLVVGVNGVGKTTSIGKIAAKLKNKKYRVIIAAADTFRAAAIDQLQVWSERAGVDMIKQQEGSDPAAVIFDSIQAVKSRNAEVLICDTAGRLHNKKNLMEELSKINRVIDREFSEAFRQTFLVLDATTGQNAIIQAKQFMEVSSVDGIILTKLDGTAKGGIVISIKHQLNLPVKLIGVGEGVEDLQDFDSEAFVEALF